MWLLLVALERPKEKPFGRGRMGDKPEALIPAIDIVAGVEHASAQSTHQPPRDRCPLPVRSEPEGGWRAVSGDAWRTRTLALRASPRRTRLGEPSIEGSRFHRLVGVGGEQVQDVWLAHL
jgi:hypothetical protein